MEVSREPTPTTLTQHHLQVAVVVSWEGEDGVVLLPLLPVDLLIFLRLLQGKKLICSDILNMPTNGREITEAPFMQTLLAQDAQDRALARLQCRPAFIWTLH
jgi:hypothetical protein